MSIELCYSEFLFPLWVFIEKNNRPMAVHLPQQIETT